MVHRLSKSNEAGLDPEVRQVELERLGLAEGAP